MRAQILALAVFATSVGAAQAASFNIDTPLPMSPAMSVTGTISGVGFTMTGFTVDDDLSNLQQASVGFEALVGGGFGFGVAGLTGDADDPAAPANPTSATDTTIDGLGVDKNELLRIVFDTPVTLFGLEFGFVDRVDDVTLRFDGGAPKRFGFGGNTSQNAGDLGDLTSFMLTGVTLDIIAGFPNSNSGGGGANDLFQLTGATVQPVPVPAALPLLGSGLGLIAWIGRRRRNRV